MSCRAKIIMLAAAILNMVLVFLVSLDSLVREKIGGFALGGTAEPVGLVPLG